MFAPCDADHVYVLRCCNWRHVIPVSQIALLSSNKMAVPHITASSTLLHLAVFLFSFNNPISLRMMEATVRLYPHSPVLATVSTWGSRHLTPPAPLPSLSQSISQCLAESCSAHFTPSTTYVHGFLVGKSKSPESFGYESYCANGISDISFQSIYPALWKRC